MFNAIHAETKKRVNSLNIEDNSSFQYPGEEKWYADPNEIIDKGKVKDIQKIEVSFVKSHSKEINGMKYWWSPYFRVNNKNNLGVKVVNESPEHRMVKNFIYNKIKKNELKFVYSSINKPYKYDNKIWIGKNKEKIDNDKLGIEVTCKNNKVFVADIIIPFKKKDNFLGKGIIVEIQFSKENKKIKNKRTLDRALQGYSVSWYHKNDFEKIAKNHIKLKDDKLKVDSMYKILEKQKEKSLQDFRYYIEKHSRELDKKIEKLKQEKRDRIIGKKCEKCGVGRFRKVNGKYGKFYACSNYPECDHKVTV